MHIFQYIILNYASYVILCILLNFILLNKAQFKSVRYLCKTKKFQPHIALEGWKVYVEISPFQKHIGIQNILMLHLF